MVFIPPLVDLTGKSEDAFTASEKLEYIANYLPDVIDEGIGITAAMGLFRDAGYSFADSSFRELYYQLTDSLTRAERVQYTNGDSTPNEAALELSSYEISGNYRFLVRYDLFNPSTNEFEDRYFWYDTDELYARNDMEDDALSEFISTYRDAGYIAVNPSFERGYRSN